MTQVANERTVRELGPLSLDGVLIQKKRKPDIRNRDFHGHLVPGEPVFEKSDEDESMKLRQMAAAAILTAGAVACNLPTLAQGLANTDDAGKTALSRKISSRSASPASMAKSTTGPSVNATKHTLGAEYKKIDSFVEFRKKLIGDGWSPVVNPHCLEAVIGADYGDYCSKYPHDIECRACEMVPEIFIYTSQGYLTTRYVKDGTPLGVLAYGDIQDLDEPGRYGLSVLVWDYKSLN
jgi:hypothetical protein